MFAEKWSVAYPKPMRGSKGIAWLSGPGVDSLMSAIVERIAEAEDRDDPLHDAWEDFAIAHRAVVKATRDGKPTEAQFEAKAEGWDGLVLDLGGAVCIPVQDLDEVQALLSVRPRGRVMRWLHVWRERVAA